VTKVFICYRRQDSIATAGRIHDRMAREFGDSNTIMDVDSIPVGRDFEAYLDKSVSRCDIFLAIIGLNWLTTLHATHDDREKDGIDYVVTEIVAALNRDIPVVPVLVDGAAMPSADELPDSLRPLARRNAIEVRNTQFHSDADRLVEKIREVIPKSFWKDSQDISIDCRSYCCLGAFFAELSC
jgi:TIR domain